MRDCTVDISDLDAFVRTGVGNCAAATGKTWTGTRKPRDGATLHTEDAEKNSLERC